MGGEGNTFEAGRALSRARELKQYNFAILVGGDSRALSRARELKPILIMIKILHKAVAPFHGRVN